MAWKFYTTLGAIKTSLQALLASLGDVVLTSPADNDLLAYDSASGKWIDQTKTEAGFGTVATYNVGTSGATVPILSAINTFSAAQNITTSGLTGTLVLTDTGANGCNIKITGDGATTPTKYIRAAGGQLQYINNAYSAGIVSFADNGGAAFGAATGGIVGAGTVNAVGLYDDGAPVTCYAIEAYKTGTVNLDYWDSLVLDLDVAARPEYVETRPVTHKVMRPQRVLDGARLVESLVEVDEPIYDTLPVIDATGKPVKDADGKPVLDRVLRMAQVLIAPAQPARTEIRTHGPAARFAPRATELLDPASYAASWKATGHLPAMPSPAEWIAAGKKMSLGDLQQRLWETVELQAIHIDKLLARIEVLEAKIT